MVQFGHKIWMKALSKEPNVALREFVKMPGVAGRAALCELNCRLVLTCLVVDCSECTGYACGR